MEELSPYSRSSESYAGPEAMHKVEEKRQDMFLHQLQIRKVEYVYVSSMA